MSAAAPSDPEHIVVTDATEELPPVAARPRRVLDRYEVIAQIAKGGMGTVYLARREGAGGFERLSAIKILHEHLAEDDTFVTMLLDEARTAAHIHHPNAVGIDDVAESPVGHYLVMSYVDGFNLAQVMVEPSLTETERIRICSRLIVDAANGLHAAHSAKNSKGEKLGIVHRDVSPQNVLVGTDGMGRIVDFGIALAASRIAASRPGTLKGKPQYMAPEQARGEPCDARTDVFALGVVLWEALTLERLFYGEMDVAILVQVMDCIVPDPRERNPRAPAALAEVAMKALSKRQEDRYATARDFGVAIERAAQASGHIATTGEVEETLARVFREEIVLKEEAVRRHLASCTGPVEPLQKGQLGLIPRMLPKKKASPKPAELATRSGRTELPSGVRSRASDAEAPTLARPSGMTPISMSTSAPSVEQPITGATHQTQQVGRGGLGKWGVALGLVGLVLLLAAVGVWMSSTTTPVATATPIADPTPPLPTTAALPPPTSVAVPATDVVAEAHEDVPPTTVEAAEVVPPPTAATATTEHTHHGHGPREATPPPSTTTTTTTTAPPPSTTTGSSSMTIETNPYLTH